jgi:uncharacterized membrane protein YbhN (UPF0104 family)
MKIAIRIGIIFILIIVAIIWFRDDFSVAFRLFQDRLTLPVAGGIVLFALICFFNEPLRWRSILKTHFPSVSFSKIYHLLTATALISYTFPARSGLPVRFFMTKKILGLDYVTVGALLIVDSLLFYTSWFVVAVIGGIVLIPHNRILTGIAGLVLITSGFIFLFIVTRADWSRLSRLQKLSNFASRLSSGLQMMTVRVGLTNTLLLACDILFYGIRHMLILIGLGVKCPLLLVTLVVAISIFAGFVSLMPLGIGGYDLSLVFLLTLIDVPRELALAVPIINRISMIGVGLILGTISLSRMSLPQKSSQYHPNSTGGKKELN